MLLLVLSLCVVPLLLVLSCMSSPLLVVVCVVDCVVGTNGVDSLFGVGVAVIVDTRAVGFVYLCIYLLCVFCFADAVVVWCCWLWCCELCCC